MTTYATVSQLREYLTQVPAGATEDALLGEMLARAHEIVTDALGGVEFATYGDAATEKDVRCGHSRPWLEIPYHEAESVASVYELAGRGASTETETEVEDWLEEEDGRLFLYSGWSSGAWYRVTAKWGYGEAPAHVVEVELEVAVNLFSGRQAGGNASFGTDSQGGQQYPRALTWNQRDVLDGVRRRYLGVVHA